MASQESAETFTAEPGKDPRLEETQRIMTLYFIIVSIILGILLFIAIRKSVKLCFFEYFYDEPEMEENDFKPATVFTVPSLLQNLQKRYEELNQSKKKKKKKHIPVHVHRRAADDKRVLTTAEFTPSSNSSGSQRMSLPPSTKERPKLFSSSSLPSTSARTSGVPEEYEEELVHIEEGVGQQKNEHEPSTITAASPHSSICVAEVNETVDHMEQSTSEPEDADIFVSEIYESSLPRRFSASGGGIASNRDSQQEDNLSSQRESYGYETMPPPPPPPPPLNHGIANAAFEGEIRDSRISNTSEREDRTESEEDTSSIQRGSLITPNSLQTAKDNLAKFAKAKFAAVDRKESSSASHFSDSELRVFVPGAVASIARDWQNRNKKEPEMFLPGIYPTEEGSHGEEEGIEASFQAEPVEPAEQVEQKADSDDGEDEVFESNHPSSYISNGESSSINDKYMDPTMTDVEILQIDDSGFETISIPAPVTGSENSTPTASMLMMSDQDKADLFTEDPLGLALADIDGLETGSEFGSSGSQNSAEGSSNDNKSPKLGQFGRFKMDWGTSKNFAKDGGVKDVPARRPRRKSRYKKNENVPQRITPHRAQRNWGKMMKELYDMGDI